ncbi:sodium-coupled monocarboxylate transporter 1-like [Asterias rubens]|uniref:sodium-coupled monocarboxylate transporter 1-like n=1 Tax=Asterias rubens TaxID=7604 RepID=UPI0014552BFE|nr:sodium-coupled monocarboxylate transporter 1-like [Asterias rubens]
MEALDKPASSYFQAADYIIFGSMMLISLAIGLYYGCSGGRQRTSTEYVLADRSMTFFPVTLSLLSSFFSGISMQGIPADVYYHGPVVIWRAIPLTIGGILAIAFYLPLYYSLGLTSVYEYLGMRFNGVVKNCGVVSFLIYALFYMGLVIYAACIAATAVMDIKFEVAVFCVCAVCAVYTVIGGIKAILWIDSVQMLLMVATILAVIFKGVMDLGIVRIWETSVRGHRADFFRFHTDLTDFYNGWGVIIGRITLINVLIANQYMVQRMVVCKSERTARLAIYGCMIGFLFVNSLLVLAGMTIYAYYEDCDPTTMGYIKKNDEILPYFVIDVFSHLPGVPGLLLTGLFGAALSTMSSVLNAIATVIGEHFVKPFARGMKDTTYAFVLKMLVLVASVSTLAVSFVIPFIGDIVAVSDDIFAMFFFFDPVQCSMQPVKLQICVEMTSEWVKLTHNPLDTDSELILT